MAAHPSSVSLLIVTRGAFDLCAALAECLRDAYGDEYTEPPGDDQLRGMIAVAWSRPLAKDAARTLHRVTFTPDAMSEDDGNASGARSDELIRDFCAEVRGLVNGDDPGIAHMVRFANPAQLRQHEALYREIYDIEMRLREVLTFIFLDEYPDRAYDFLKLTPVKPPGGHKALTSEYLKAHDENPLFHILFDEYDDLNKSPAAQAKDIIDAAVQSRSFEQFQTAVGGGPISRSRASAFIASLADLTPSIEVVRNAIAHNRDLPDDAKANYETARKQVLAIIADFWKAEIDSNPLQSDVVASLLPASEPASPRGNPDDHETGSPNQPDSVE